MTAEKTLAQHADAAHEEVRRIAALTVFQPPLTAPDLYPVLGSLVQLGHSLQQALGQLAVGLARSPEFYDLREDDLARDPAVSIAEAGDWLTSAAEHAAVLGHALGKARTAIAGQSWRSKADQPGPDVDDDKTDR